MSAHASKPRAKRPRRMRWSMLPFVVAIAAVATANLGLSVVGGAGAATDTVAVTANVSSASSVSDGCAPTASALVISGAGSAASGTALTMGAFNYGHCTVSFGATNNAALPLQAYDAAGAGAFFSTNPSGFTEDTGTACDAALTSNEVGYKVASGGSATMNVCAATPTASSSNLDYTKFPDTATTACTTTALGNQTCNIAVGLLAPASATSGANTGTINLSA